MHLIKITSNAEEFIRLEGNFSLLKKANLKGELQYIDSKPMIVGITIDSGYEVPDIITEDSLIFISKKMKDFFDKFGIDYVFYKKVEVRGEEYGIYEVFYLMIVPRVDCLELDSLPQKDVLWDYRDGLIPLINNDEAPNFRIIKAMIGRYDIFRVLGLYQNVFYITDKLYQELERQSFIGLLCIQCQND